MDETHPLSRKTIAGENVSVQNTATLSPFIYVYTVNCCCCCSFLPNIKSPPSLAIGMLIWKTKERC